MIKNRAKLTKAVAACALSSVLLFTGCQALKVDNGNAVDTSSTVTTTAKQTGKESTVTTAVTTTAKPVETEKKIQLFAYQEGDLYGYKDSDGKVVIKPIYSYAEDFVGNRGIVRVPSETESYGMLGEEFFALIDADGEYIIPPEGIIIRAGEKRYLTYGPADLWPYYGTSGWNMIKFRFTDENGNHLTEPEYFDAVEITKDLFLANNGRYSLFIDANGVYIEDTPVFRFYSKIQVKDDTIIVTPYDDTQDRIVFTLSKNGTLLGQVSREVKISDNLFYTTEIISPYIGTSFFYPVFDGENIDLANQLNENIGGILDNLLGGDSPFDTVVNTFSPTSQIDRTLTIDYAVSKINNLLNIDMDGYWYGFGAAHPNAFVLSYYMDLVTGQQYTLSDLFSDSIDWRTELAKMIDKKFINEPEMYLYIDESTPEQERLEQFYREDYYASFTEEGLVIYYQQYDIAPYAAGFPLFEFSYEELLPLINQEGDLYKSLVN